MGKWLYTNLYTIFSQLGTYAFPNGKPQIDWGGGNPPVIPPCTVSKTIGTGLSSTGGDSDVALGDSLEVSIAITDNLYIIDDDNVVVTMGGTDITSTAWNASTQKVTIAAVTGNVVINIPSLTYVGYGEQNSPLVLHLDGKNMGSTANQWRNLCNDNKPLVLSGGYTKNSDGVTFDGNDGTGLIDGLNIELPYLQSTAESVFSQASNAGMQVMAINGYDKNTILGTTKETSNAINTFCCTMKDGDSAAPSGAKGGVLTGLYGVNEVHHLVNYGNAFRLDNQELSLISSPRCPYIGISTSTHDMTGDFSVSGYTSRANTFFAPYNGKIFAIRMYNRVLTGAEMTQNHKVDKKRFNIQ